MLVFPEFGRYRRIGGQLGLQENLNQNQKPTKRQLENIGPETKLCDRVAWVRHGVQPDEDVGGGGGSDGGSFKTLLLVVVVMVSVSMTLVMVMIMIKGRGKKEKEEKHTLEQGVVVHSCHSSTLEMEGGGSGEFKASLGYMRSYVKQTRRNYKNSNRKTCCI